MINIAYNDKNQQSRNESEVIAAESVQMDRDTMNLAHNYCRGELKNDINAFGSRHANKIISEVVNFVKGK